VLDEPTNHLDISSRETLEDMLIGYDGTVVFVSHDRFLIDRVATRVWEIEQGSLVAYLGNYSDMLRQKGRQGLPEPPAPLKTPTSADSVNDVPRTQARRIGMDSESRLQRRLSATEREIGRLEGRLNELSDAIAIAGIDGDRDGLERLSTGYADTSAQLDDAYALWEELNSQLETAAVPASSV
jgi:ATP-binding cassette subfamily F protein 3